MKKLAVVLSFFLLFVFMIGFAEEEYEGQQVWVLCNPESYVILHTKPKKTSMEFGGVLVGSDMLTDGKTRNGFLHVYDLAAEYTEGWITTRHIVYSEPEEIYKNMKIVSNGRVACRKWVNGKIIHWAYNGNTVFVYFMCEEWAVTNKGYIMSEFLEPVEEPIEKTY